MWHSRQFDTQGNYDLRAEITAWLNELGAADLVVTPNLTYWTVFAYVEDKNVAAAKCPTCGSVMKNGVCPKCGAVMPAAPKGFKAPMVTKAKKAGVPKAPFKK